MGFFSRAALASYINPTQPPMQRRLGESSSSGPRRPHVMRALFRDPSDRRRCIPGANRHREWLWPAGCARAAQALHAGSAADRTPGALSPRGLRSHRPGAGCIGCAGPDRPARPYRPMAASEPQSCFGRVPSYASRNYRPIPTVPVRMMDRADPYNPLLQAIAAALDIPVAAFLSDPVGDDGGDVIALLRAWAAIGDTQGHRRVLNAALREAEQSSNSSGPTAVM